MKDGRTVREHLVAFAELHPVEGAEELAAVTPDPLPPCAAQASAAFELLSSTRRSGLTPSPLSLGDVVTYDQHVAPLTPRERGWVLTMDRAFLSAIAEGAAHG
jgi:hypothetical protein